MRNLCLDIGNSFIKIAIFDNDVLTDFSTVVALTNKELEKLIDDHKPDNAIISSVAENMEHFEDLLRARTNYKRFSTVQSLKVKNEYKSKATLGLDRWAAILGANFLYPNSTTLVIDSGTCITYDVLTKDAEYFGGSISPGIAMRFKALNHFASRLPLVSWNADEPIEEGTDTDTAIRSGVLQGIVNEVEGFIMLNAKKYKALRVIITGGDGNFLFKQLQSSIFAPQIIIDPLLVLKGLNQAIVD